MSSIASQNTRKRTNVMIPDHVFGALVFVFVELMFYSALMSSFLVMRRGRDSWGQNDAMLLPIWPELFNGLVLGLSALSLFLAVRAFERSPSQARGHIFRALVLALLFSAFQLVLGLKLHAAGVTLNSSVFAGCMYLMLGSHLLQALFGALWMGKLVFDLGNNRSGAAGALRGLTVLWCCVAALWPFIYVVLSF